MDFINPRKRRASKIRLLVGYGLMVVLILMLTTVLLYDAYGYGFGKNGQIIQNGLVFLSSDPSPAQIYINDVLNNATTNSRLKLPAGQYKVELKRNGYRSWARAVGVEGGSVEHFDYPFLFPVNLATSNISGYGVKPGLMLQSPDRRWLLVEQPGKFGELTEYDLSNPKKLVNNSTTISMPAGLLTSTTGTQTMKLVDWADSRYVLLQHNFSGQSEYILFDRQKPADSINLTRQLNLSSNDQLAIFNTSHTQFYLYSKVNKTLGTITVPDGVQTPILSDVLAFKSYGSNVLEYATNQNASKVKVNIDIWQNGQSYRLQQLSDRGNYLLGITRYNGSWYAADGVSTGTKVYIYMNPVAQLQGKSSQPLVPAYILQVPNPNYVSFSTSNQFIVAEGSNEFAVFDAQNQKGYSYDISGNFTAGQHIDWMDGSHLDVSVGNVVRVWDYDGANLQTLQPSANGSAIFFDPNYKWSYTLAPSGSSNPHVKYELTSTALRVPADQ